ncbi:MAG: hypothetical protein CM15mV111_220 [uncultured marine virus]|nr:MAG: hypothetical protein CM15mV111_220 [uncultured marine virus]
MLVMPYFYLADDGFYMFDGKESRPIGAEKVNKFFLEDWDGALQKYVVGCRPVTTSYYLVLC